LLSEVETVQEAAVTAEHISFEHYKLQVIGAIDNTADRICAQHDHYIHGTPKSFV